MAELVGPLAVWRCSATHALGARSNLGTSYCFSNSVFKPSCVPGLSLLLHRNLTVKLTDEVRFTCNDPGLTLWLLPSEEDYDSCTAGVGAERLTECPEAGGEYSLYIVPDNVQNTVQSNFVRVSSGQTEVYVACELTADVGACDSCDRAVVGVSRLPPAPPLPCSSVLKWDESRGVCQRSQDGHQGASRCVSVCRSSGSSAWGVHVCVPFTLIVYLHLPLSVCVADRYSPARLYSQLANEIHDPFLLGGACDNRYRKTPL